MKKYIFAALSAVLVLGTSCNNDEIVVEADHKTNSVDVTVSLNDFFSNYNFNDTYHGRNILDDFRSFNSESNLYIQVRTLFYNDKGELTDSIVSYSTNTNAVTSNIKLAEGLYTVISTLTFAEKNSGDKSSYWSLKGKDKISTAALSCKNRFWQWSIMSYDSKSLTVQSGKKNSVSMNPLPVGALCYICYDHFQYKQDGNLGDNNIRKINLYSQNVATDYKLDPNATDKYVYLNDIASSWYHLSYQLEPSDFDPSSTYFQTNIVDYCHILAPRFNFYFGYILKGETTFMGYGYGDYSINSGKTYLAYWDYLNVGNPWFGIADNNHWNTSSAHELNNFKSKPHLLNQVKLKDAVFEKE